MIHMILLPRGRGDADRVDGDEVTARQLVNRAAPGEERHAEVHFDGVLDSVEAWQGDHHLQLNPPPFKQAVVRNR